MRVIKPGLAQPIESLIGQCSRCGCKISAQKTDAEVIPIRWTDRKFYYKSECPNPNCSGMIHLREVR